MASGLAARLPLSLSDVFGAYDLLTTYEEVAKQNLKMLILTNPGERVMDPNFGVGIRQFLFEQETRFLQHEIQQRIIQQVSKYLPYLDIIKIDFFSPEDMPDYYPHTLNVVIKFTITPISRTTSLDLDLSNN